MIEERQAKIEQLEPDEEELTPEQVEEAQGGFQGALTADTSSRVRYHFTGPEEL
jgi:hypothetical protein